MNSFSVPDLVDRHRADLRLCGRHEAQPRAAAISHRRRRAAPRGAEGPARSGRCRLPAFRRWPSDRPRRANRPGGVHPEPDEPAKQQIELQPLHDLPLRADAIEGLQEQRPQEPLRWDQRPTEPGIQRRKIGAEPIERDPEPAVCARCYRALPATDRRRRRGLRTGVVLRALGPCASPGEFAATLLGSAACGPSLQRSAHAPLRARPTHRAETVPTDHLTSPKLPAGFGMAFHRSPAVVPAY